MAKQTTKKFNRTTATLTEVNRELKRLANRKCLAKTPEDKAKWDKQYQSLAKFKREKFETSKKPYIQYSMEDIQNMTIEQLTKGIASLSSTKTNYPERTTECLEQMNKFKDRRDFLKAEIELERLKNMLGIE